MLGRSQVAQISIFLFWIEPFQSVSWDVAVGRRLDFEEKMEEVNMLQTVENTEHQPEDKTCI